MTVDIYIVFRSLAFESSNFGEYVGTFSSYDIMASTLNLSGKEYSQIEDPISGDMIMHYLDTSDDGYNYTIINCNRIITEE